MIDVMIEQWKNLDGSVDYLWSVWQAGSRLHMGGTHDTAEAAEQEARSFCRQRYNAEPASVTQV